jgi:RNA polymerase sigma-70 factor (ECF subfamily)
MLASLETATSKNQPLEGVPRQETQDAAWVEASQRGDTLAFNRLVLKWEKSIYNLTLRMLQNPEEAAEAAQEVFLSAYRNIRRFRRNARFSTWLYRIAVNHCISRLRRRPPGVHYSFDRSKSAASAAEHHTARQSHESEFLLEERRSRVRSALEFLSPEQRTVVELKFFQDLTFEEIADVVKAPSSTVKSRLYAGLDILKLRLGSLA